MFGKKSRFMGLFILVLAVGLSPLNCFKEADENAIRVGASKGLGVFMLRASNSFRTDWVFAAIAISSLLSILLFLAVATIERLSLPWYYTTLRKERWEEVSS